MSEEGSTVPRRQLGRLLRQAREKEGISVADAAKRVQLGRATMYRIESGETSVRVPNVKAMCELYQVSPDMTEVIVGLAELSKAKGWWHSYGEVIPEWFDLYLGLEAAASRLRQYSTLIPGLLQMPAYAEAVIQLEPGVTGEQVAQNVRLRIERQRLLARSVPPAPELNVILDEAVLRRSIADREAMRAQLSHLTECARLPRVNLRVLPTASGPHAASRCAEFVILEFPQVDNRRDPEPTTIYSESLTGSLYLDKPAEVAAYEKVWRSLEALALDGEASVNLMESIEKEYASGPGDR